MNTAIAFSMLEIKSLNEDQRMITGYATTPDMDRTGDVIDPMGAIYSKEIPLLWQHKHDSPVGIAELGVPNAKGIPFKAVIANIEEPGPLKSLVDLAWQSVKARLVRGVSIGLLNKNYEIMKNGGKKYLRPEIFELSLVTIPANASATIQTIKALSGYRDDNSRGAVPLIDRLPAKTIDLGGAVKLVSASRLASLPLKAN